jgi:hypothetical protein
MHSVVKIIGLVSPSTVTSSRVTVLTSAYASVLGVSTAETMGATTGSPSIRPN